MLISIAVVLLSGLAFGWICKKVRVPALFGMIIAGMLAGPHALDLLDGSLLSVSADLRRIALIIILIRAGLKLDLADLRKVGRPALLICFVPACFEVAGTVLLAPLLLGLSALESAILGAVIAAVSPAVVVPRMIRLMDERRGTGEGIPQMILAGASADDVFVIVLFTAFTGIARGESLSVLRFVSVPVSVLTGILIGGGVGFVLACFFDRARVTPVVRTVLLFAAGFILNWAEGAQDVVPFAGLIAIMAAGTVIKRRDGEMARQLSDVFDKLWVPAEIFLFVLVGASVAAGSVRSAGLPSVLLVFGALVFRMAGVLLSVAGTGLTWKEKAFCMLSYTPKATVQAAIGGLPLAMGLDCGGTVLTVSVIAILITAPLGAFAIDGTCNRFLRQETAKE